MKSSANSKSNMFKRWIKRIQPDSFFSSATPLIQSRRSVLDKRGQMDKRFSLAWITENIKHRIHTSIINTQSFKSSFPDGATARFNSQQQPGIQ